MRAEKKSTYDIRVFNTNSPPQENIRHINFLLMKTTENFSTPLKKVLHFSFHRPEGENAQQMEKLC